MFLNILEKVFHHFLNNIMKIVIEGQFSFD